MRLTSFWIVALIAALLPNVSDAEVKARSLEERARIRSELNIKRVNTLLLPAMRKAGIDCWIIMSREFNKDFVLEYIEDNRENTPGGHRNAYIFFDDGSDKPKKILLGTHLPRDSQLWDEMVSYHSGAGDEGPSLKPILGKTIRELDPKKIGINQSRTIPMSDGLTVEMKTFLVDAIGPDYEKRLVSAEMMITDFLDTRLPEEMVYFKEAAEMSKMIHYGVLDMIQPGKTQIKDMRWWIYNKLAELDIDTWYFHGLRAHRQGVDGRLDADSTVIQPGDIINNDIGVVYMGFHTDYKGTGYVLKPGETEPPKGLQDAFKNSLRVQDAVFEIAKEGKLGHQVRSESMALCEKWGIDGSVYSHSVGVGGHGIGAWMNPSWPDRYGIRPTFPLRVGAVYAVESHATTVIPEWGGQKLRINTEEDVVLTEEGFKYVVPRQEKIHIIQSSVDPNVRFTDNGDGTATDTRTGLMWTIEDNGSNADWNAANVHCQTLALADHGDWRMPTVEELEALHFEGRAISNCHEIEGKSIPCYIYKPFTLSGMSMWSSNKRDASSAWLFSFYLGQRAISTLDRTGTRRVLCVRSPWTGDGPRQIER